MRYFQIQCGLDRSRSVPESVVIVLFRWWNHVGISMQEPGNPPSSAKWFCCSSRRQHKIGSGFPRAMRSCEQDISVQECNATPHGIVCFSSGKKTKTCLVPMTCGTLTNQFSFSEPVSYSVQSRSHFWAQSPPFLFGESRSNFQTSYWTNMPYRRIVEP